MPQKVKSSMSWSIPILLNLFLMASFARAAQFNFGPIADQVAAVIKSQNKVLFPRKVVVIDFSVSGSRIDSLSSLLADQLSADLEVRLRSHTIIPRSTLLEVLGLLRISPFRPAVRPRGFLGS